MPTPSETASFAELIANAQVVSDQIGDAVTGYYAWAGGTATGGPNSNGEYPLSVPGGPIRLVPCPAKIAAIAEEGGSAPSSPLTAAAVMALESVGTSEGTEWIPAVSPDGILRRMRPNMFASRRTADLYDISRLTGNELLPALTEAGVGGQERRIALKELHRAFTGVINPKLPPYNCKGDMRISEGGSTTAGSNVITLKESMFSPDDVGKLIFVSNNTTNGNNYQSTITQYISPTQTT